MARARFARWMSLALFVGAAAPAARAEEALAPDVAAVLADADAFAVVSIDPKVHRPWGYGKEADDGRPLARWLEAVAGAEGVYGRVEVADGAERAAIGKALAAGRAAEGPAAGCYDPRHAIVARKGDVTVAIHLCFACHYAVILTADTAKGRLVSFQDVGGLKARLDGLLRAGKVALAEDMEKAEEAASRGEKGPQLSAPMELFGLSEPDTMEVYGLEPSAYDDFGYGELTGEGTPYAQAMARLASGRGVKAKATVTRASARKALSDQLYRGYARGGDPAKCFNPRHALVLKTAAKEAVFFLCFECSYATAIGPKTEGGRNLVTFSDPGHLKARLDLILASAPAAPAAPTAPPAAAAPAAPAAATYDVVLTDAGSNKLLAIKVVRAATGLGLKASKDLVESVPQPVKTGLSKADADALVQSFADAGAKAEARPSAK